MSVSTEVQRTLVKSPPELWSELSDPEALARHLGELGEIRITSVEPETKVEWEADSASGVVHLKQSGWGTKVTLSVTRSTPAGREPSSEPEAIAEAVSVAVEAEPLLAVEPELEPDTPAAEPTKPVSEIEPELDAEPVVVVEPEPVPVVELEPLAGEPQLVTLVEPEPATGEPEPVLAPEPIVEPEPRLGFFARLFRRRKPGPHELLDSRQQPEGAEPEIEVVALAAPEPIYPARPIELEPRADEPPSDLAAELASVEAQMTQETTELLTGVLDRLGAAHHRPFSRG